MKQLLILSGKGGTGKTTIASASIKLAGAQVYTNCDLLRSEERRVGKECRSRWSPYH